MPWSKEIQKQMRNKVIDIDQSERSYNGIPKLLQGSFRGSKKNPEQHLKHGRPHLPQLRSEFNNKKQHKNAFTQRPVSQWSKNILMILQMFGKIFSGLTMDRRDKSGTFRKRCVLLHLT
ncbi:hypothetical protein AMECASPLE_000744 [Ameca splendens]|uniref:Uncharacterized protein n=1 Tax=Ameca splendens TaxID=208324 RepID=A0ABV1A453_9TELE